MKIAAIVSTKGGPGKTTVGANLCAFCADAGLRTLLIDFDNQPSLSSFYALSHEAPGGTYQLIANNETRADQIISQTCIPNLSLIHSNDPFNQLSNLLLHAADGRLRLKNLMPAFESDFDLILIDTPPDQRYGWRCVFFTIAHDHPPCLAGLRARGLLD